MNMHLSREVRLMRVLCLAAMFVCLLCLLAPGAGAARFQRLYYGPEVQELSGVLLKEDEVSCWILNPDGDVLCLTKSSLRVLEETPLEDAALLLRLGHDSRALDLYEATLAAATSAARRGEVEGCMRRAAGMLKSASSLVRLAARFPDDAEVQYQLGRAYMDQRRFKAASEAMQKAATLDLARLDYRVGLAEAQLRLGQRALLAGDRDSALSILADVPGSASVPVEVRWLSREDFLARLGSAESKAWVRYDPHLFVGRYLVDFQMQRLAGPYLVAASEAHPADPAVHNYLAHVFLYFGREDEAAAEMILGDENPANHPPFPERVQRLVELRDKELALRHYIEQTQHRGKEEEKKQQMQEILRKLAEEKEKERNAIPAPGQVIFE